MSDTKPDQPDDIKASLPANIKIGGKVINTGKMTINGVDMPSVPEAAIPSEELPNKDDGLSPYIQRIREAMDYTGFDDREDVRSILKQLLANHDTALYTALEASQHLYPLNCGHDADECHCKRYYTVFMDDVDKVFNRNGEADSHE